MLPRIEQNYIDCYSVGSFKFVVYASKLVFGKPVFDEKSTLIFEENSYIAIHNYDLGDYFEFVEHLKNLCSKKSEHKLYKKETIVTSAAKDTTKNYVSFLFQQDDQDFSELEITSNYATKFSFKLNIEEIYYFRIGFGLLFFKIHAYPPKINLTIKSILLSDQEKDRILSDSTKKDIDLFKLVDSYVGFILTSHEYFLVHEILVRHRKFLVKWQNLLQTKCIEEL